MITPKERPQTSLGQEQGLGIGCRGAARARRDSWEARIRGDRQLGGDLRVLAGPAQLTRQRRQSGRSVGRVVGAGWGGVVGCPPSGPLTCARCNAGARRGQGCKSLRRRCPGDRGGAGALGGGAVGPAARPRPAPPPPHAPPPSLRARLWGSEGFAARLDIFQAAEVQLTELGALPRPAPQGPSARL